MRSDPAQPGFDRADYTKLDDAELGRRHRRGDPRARDVLIERYLPFARRLARRHGHPGDPLFDDLCQVASLGLVKAVSRWDPDRGFAFTTFAFPTIRGELRRFLRDTTWAVRPPRDLMELALALRRARHQVRGAAGEATPHELAAHLGRSTEAVLEAMQAAKARSARTLDAPVLDDAPEGPTVEDGMGELDAGYARVEARDEIESLSRGLDRRARRIVQLRFDEGLLQAQIAERVGISQMHVSRTLRDSLEKLGSAAQR
jgi:RNA polymerase sigma-B factor